MRNLKFKYAKAENFLCFNNIEINFEQYGNIVCIKGRNFDVNEDGDNASNASGKSSISEIIVYALFGKTVKKPKKLNHPDIINNKNEKDLKVELRWDDYRIIRTRGNKDTLRLWQSDKGIWNKDTEISKGAGIPATQKLIESKLGLTYESFINIFIFSDDNTLAFLECDATNKRKIVENLLSLEKYHGYHENTKNILKSLKDKIKELTKDYDNLTIQKDGATTLIAQIEKQEADWYETKKKELDNILKEIRKKVDELETSKNGTALVIYQEAQEQIKDLKDRVPQLEERKTRLSELVAVTLGKADILQDKINNTDKERDAVKSEYEKLQKLVNDNNKIIEGIKNKTGKNCPYCLSVVDESNFSDMLEKANAELSLALPQFQEAGKKYELVKNQAIQFAELKRKVEQGVLESKTKINVINSEITQIHCEIARLAKIKCPDSDVAELVLSEQLDFLKKQSVDKQEELKGVTPFAVIKQTAINDLSLKIKECADKKQEVKSLEYEVPYYEFWVKAFGDNGIRKYVIDGIIPTLNDQIEYWLQFLIDNKIRLSFNSELEETIDRYPFNGRRYVYHGTSGGQRRRLNLTVAAAWAYISALNSGAAPSCIFLDEVTMNMDVVGVQGIFRMICELAKDKQVFVIDHNETLLRMLSGCDTIYLEMRDEISKKVDNFNNN